MDKRLRQLGTSVAIPIVAILLGLFVSSLFVAMSETDPVGAYNQLFCEGFGSRQCDTFGDLFIVDVEIEGEDDTVIKENHIALFYGEKGHQLAVVLERATPLILTALAATVAFKAGLFSIGMDGQLVLGGVAAVFLGYWLPDQIYMLAGVAEYDEAPELMRTVMHLVIPAICISAAMFVGAIYSWFAGYLKVKLNVNELISTIILNIIAVQFVGYLINFPMRADMNSIARTHRIDDTAWLIPFTRGIFADIDWFKGSRMGIGFVIAILAGIFVWYFLWRSTHGYEQRMTSGSKLFARFGGIPSQKAALRAMLLSGALSGLAGAIMILGVERRVVDGWAGSATGFDGVLVAILARESILGIFIVAVFFAGLTQGAINLQFGNLPRQLGGIIISFIILFNSMDEFFRNLLSRINTALSPKRKAKPLEAPSGGD